MGNLLYNFGKKKAGGNFSPSSLTNLVLWLDAQNTGSITQSSGNVTAWNDLSGNSNNYTTATAAGTVTVTTGINGHQAILFATGKMSQVSGISIVSNFTCYLVIKPTGLTQQFYMAKGGFSNGLFDLAPGSNVSEIYDGANFVDFNDTTTSGTVATYIFTGGGAPASATMKKNGSVLTQNGHTGSSWSGLNQGAIGSGAGVDFVVGYIGEIVLVNGTVSAGDNTSMISYLTRWN